MLMSRDKIMATKNNIGPGVEIKCKKKNAGPGI